MGRMGPENTQSSPLLDSPSFKGRQIFDNPGVLLTSFHGLIVFVGNQSISRKHHLHLHLFRVPFGEDDEDFDMNYILDRYPCVLCLFAPFGLLRTQSIVDNPPYWTAPPKFENIIHV